MDIAEIRLWRQGFYSYAERLNIWGYGAHRNGECVPRLVPDTAKLVDKDASRYKDRTPALRGSMRWRPVIM
uniref:Uncharacterized protein n=1 Tax=Ralstonia solanacearum TaxID=305 RepID=A0A0S4UEY0_RALSL|nr:protein of unknown function [Ralstonia solanacearum]